MRRHDAVKGGTAVRTARFSYMRQRLIDDAQHWRDRAEEFRTQAEHMDADARMMMLGIAESYEKLARRAEERTRQLRTDQPAFPALGDLRR